MRSIVAFNLQGAEDRALARASMIADLPKARSLFAAQDRAGLLAEYGKMFTEVWRRSSTISHIVFDFVPSFS